MSESLVSQLEPQGLMDAFVAHPPSGFTATHTPDGVISFQAPFDLLTTADDDFRNKLQGLPLYNRWAHLLTWRTRFVGTTVSEYAPLPRATPAGQLAKIIQRQWASDCQLLIVKDIAQHSPLLDEPDNEYNRAFIDALVSRGFVLVEGQALAWLPIDFSSEDGYLARLSYSRRKDIRRKLRSRDQLDAVETVSTGDARFHDPTVLAEFYALYEQVYAQSEVHFDRLTLDFFRQILQDANSHGLVFVYRHKGKMIGWNLCYQHKGKLIDKYIGLAYPAAREHNLYFVSWMHNLNVARERGLSHFVAGWTDPQVKISLGAQMTWTCHAVHVRNRLLRALLKPLATRFESDRSQLAPVPNQS